MSSLARFPDRRTPAALFLTGVPTDVTNGNTPTAGYFNGARTTGGIPAEVYYLGPQGQNPAFTS